MSPEQCGVMVALFSISSFIAFIGYFHLPESDVTFKRYCYWGAGFFLLPLFVKMLLILF